MSQYKDFTSLPPEQEQTFVVFEQRSVEAGQKAIKLGAIVAGAFGLITMIVVLAISPGESTADKMNEDELSKGGGMLSGESEVAADKKNAPTPAAAVKDDSTDDDDDETKPEAAADDKKPEEAAADDKKPEGDDDKKPEGDDDKKPE